MSEYGSRRVTLTADGAVNANRTIKITGDLIGAECDAVTDYTVGISEDTVADGETFVCLLLAEPVIAECSAALTAGGFGAPNTDARIKPAVATNVACCVILSTTAAAGEQVDILPITPFTVA